MNRNDFKIVLLTLALLLILSLPATGQTAINDSTTDGYNCITIPEVNPKELAKKWLKAD